MPRPRKLKPASVRMASAMFRGNMTATEAIMLGKMYRTIMVAWEAQGVLAASTYSPSFTDSTWPLTTLK